MESGKTGRDESSSECDDFWLLRATSTKHPSRQWLAQGCTFDKWESSSRVDEKQHTFTLSGNSLFEMVKHDSELVLSLDPIRVLEVSSGRMSMQVLHDERWNWQRFAGSSTLGVDYCEGKQPASTAAVTDRDAPLVQTDSVAIPAVDLPASYLADGWQRVGLGRCAVRIDGAGNGFTIHGRKGPPEDASLRAVMSEAKDLFIEVEDDRFVTGEKGWIHDDHVEIWRSGRISRRK